MMVLHRFGGLNECAAPFSIKMNESLEHLQQLWFTTTSENLYLK